MPLPVPDLAFSASREVWRDKSAIALRLVERVRGPRASAATSSSCASTPSGSAACASGRTAGCAGRASGTARAHAAHSRVSGRRRQRQLKNEKFRTTARTPGNAYLRDEIDERYPFVQVPFLWRLREHLNKKTIRQTLRSRRYLVGKIPRQVSSTIARNRSRIAAWPLVRL